MKIGCLIYFFGKKYQKIGNCAVSSFKKHNPDVVVHHIHEGNEAEYECYKLKEQLAKSINIGLYKYMLAADIMKKHSYDKMIVLGGDTITCARLDEFIDNNEADIIGTLDYPYAVSYPYRDMKKKQLVTVYVPTVLSPPPYTDYCINGNNFFSLWGTAVPASGQTDHWRAQARSALDSTGYNFPTVRTSLARVDCKAPSYIAPDLEVIKTPPYKGILIDYMHLNGDVVCFNNCQALKDVIKITLQYEQDWKYVRKFYRAGSCLTTDDFYSEQGGLNILSALSINPFHERYNYKIAVADGPYTATSVLYNVRSKGNIGYNPEVDIEKPWKKYINTWYVEDNKLFMNLPPPNVPAARKTKIQKQIKVWHYCEGLGNYSDLESYMNEVVFGWFNKDTKKYFTEQCDCGDFFEKEFTF